MMRRGSLYISKAEKTTQRRSLALCPEDGEKACWLPWTRGRQNRGGDSKVRKNHGDGGGVFEKIKLRPCSAGEKEGRYPHEEGTFPLHAFLFW
jgi:hypothetical protein